MPTKEVPLRTKASLARVEHEYHAVIAKDGVSFVKVGLFIVRSAESDQTDKNIALC